MQLQPEMLDRFWCFVDERHEIYRRRFILGHKRPWTDDPILGRNHFTNVYRELDPGTEFAQAAIAKRPDRQEAIFFTVAYRGVNRMATISDFERDHHPLTSEFTEEWLQYLIDRKASGLPTWTGRHYTTAPKNYRAGVRDAAALEVPSNPREAYAALRTLAGVGTFFGWQMLCDLVEAGLVDFDPDHVVVGPGALWGLNAITGLRTFDQYVAKPITEAGTVFKQPTPKQMPKYEALICEMRDTQPVKLAEPLSVKNIEHALCEWFRYETLTLKRQRGLR